MKIEWYIILATLFGPILAVQAQKAIERANERRSRKSQVFHKLMATRAARVSMDHVQALNMIDLVFYGRRFLGIQRRSKSEQNVLDAWKEYHDHLGTKAEDKAVGLWHARGDELFVNLLYAMAEDVGYKFDRVQLKKGAYSPMAHGDLEFEQSEIRKRTISLLSGESAIKMDVASFPFEQAELDKQKEVQRGVDDTLSDEMPPAVRVSKLEDEVEEG